MSTVSTKSYKFHHENPRIFLFNHGWVTHPPEGVLLYATVELYQTSFQIMHLVKDVPMSTSE